MFRNVAVILLCSFLMGCTPNYTILEHSDITLPASGERPVIVVEMVNGPITITTAKCKEITGKLTKRGVGADKEEAEKELQLLAFDFQPNTDGKIVVKALRTDGNKNWKSSGAEATLQVPLGSKLELITSNGRIQVTGKNQGVIAKTKNGSVQTREGQSTIDVNTENGAVNCSDVVGNAHIVTSNAAVKLRGRQLQLDCKTSNGSISFQGDLVAGNHQLHTSNGHITATLPRDINLNLEANTSSGRITNEFSFNKNASGTKSNKTNIKGTVGEGESNQTLVLKTSNSSIAIKRDNGKKDEAVVID